MKNFKLYDWESNFDFGQCKGKSLKEVFKKSPSYISWCFQSINEFCITDEIFEKLPVVIDLKSDNSKKDWLKTLIDKHSRKKKKLQVETRLSVSQLGRFDRKNEP